MHVFDIEYSLPTVTDVDECSEGAHNCDQLCTNIVGSFTCSCNTGYTLDSDGRTCIGIHMSLSSTDDIACYFNWFHKCFTCVSHVFVT